MRKVPFLAGTFFGMAFMAALVALAMVLSGRPGPQSVSAAAIPEPVAIVASGDESGAPAPAEAPAEAPAPELPLHYGIDPAQSSAKFFITQTVLFSDSVAVGTVPNVSGDVFLTPEGALTDQTSSFRLDLNGVRSNDFALNSYLRSDGLEQSKFPIAEFIIESVDGIPANFRDGNEFSFTVSGPLTMHGVTRHVTWAAKGRQSGDFLAVAAELNFLMTDFRWTPPNYGIAKAKNNVRLQVTFVAGTVQ
jgi:polyisoprenoid-binding protein YceI